MVAEKSVQQVGEGPTKSGRIIAFAFMLVAFWAAAGWQITDNRRDASEDEVHALEEEGDCEARYVKAWSSVGPDGRESNGTLTKSEVQSIRALCLREARMEEKRAKREAAQER